MDIRLIQLSHTGQTNRDTNQYIPLAGKKIKRVKNRLAEVVFQQGGLACPFAIMS